MSNRLTFSLASLILIFAAGFALLIPSIAEAVDPTFGTETIANIELTVGDSYQAFLPAATDSDGNIASYTLARKDNAGDDADPTYASLGFAFNSNTAIRSLTSGGVTLASDLAGTDNNLMGATGTYVYTAIDNDDDTATLEFTITVKSSVTIASTVADQTLKAGKAFELRLPTATDSRSGASISYTLVQSDGGGSVANGITGLIFTDSLSTVHGTPTAATAVAEEEYTYTATADLGGSQASAVIKFKIEVVVPSSPAFGPVTITSISGKVGEQIVPIVLPIATDADGDAITYTLEDSDGNPQDLPAGLTTNPAGPFTSLTSSVTVYGTPTAKMAETAYVWTATSAADDDTTAGVDTATKPFNITIAAADNTAPVFADATTTRSVQENTAAGSDIGDPVTATDANTGDTLTYSLSGTDVASFAIVADSGQLQTKAALDYETKKSYMVTVTATDAASATDTIDVTINITNDTSDDNTAPVFADATTTRSVQENTAAGSDIGDPVTATDANTGDTLTYSLSGTDVASFAIVEASGQLQTKAALDYETKKSYMVTVTATDAAKATDTIDVTINITNDTSDDNTAPVFADATTTRSVQENTAAGSDIGDPVTATDADTGDTLVYSLSGTDAASFAIVTTSGQLQTKAALDYETKTSYTVTVTATDDASATDTIDVTINITNDASDDPADISQPTAVTAVPQGNGSIMVSWTWTGTTAEQTALAGFTVKWGSKTMEAAKDQTSYTIPADQLTAGQSTTVSVLARATAGSGYATPAAGTGAPSAVTPANPKELRFVDATGALVTSLGDLTFTAGTAITDGTNMYIQLPRAIGGVENITYTLRKGFGESDVTTSGDNGLMVDLTELRLHGTPTAAAAKMQYQWRATDVRGEGVKKLNFFITVNPGPAALTVTISTSAPTVGVKDNFTVAFTTSNNVTNVAAVLDTASVAAGYTISSATPTAATGVTIMQAKSKVAGQATPAADVTLTLTPSGSSGAGTPATITVPFAERPFDAADWDQTPPIVVIGDVADDQGSDFEVRFSVTDKGNPSGVTDPAGLDTDIHGNIDGIEVTILGPANAATYEKLTEARPYRVTNSIGDITFASFSMMIKPTRKENRVGIRIQVEVPDRAGNKGMHEISVTLGPKDFVPVVTSNPNIISCLTGSTITVTFDRKLAVDEELTRDEIKLSNPDIATYPDNVNKVGWQVVAGSITAPSFNSTTSQTTVQFKVMPKSDRSWIGQTRLRVHIAPDGDVGLDAPAVKDLGANTNAKNKHDKLMVGGKPVQDPDDPRFPLRMGTFTIGPVLEIEPRSYIAVARDKPNPFGTGSTLALSHLGDTTLTVADKNVRALKAEVQGWECMPDLGVLLGIEPYQVPDDENDRASTTRLAVTGGGGIIVKESPEHGKFDNPNELVKGTVGISEMMWAIDRSKLFGAASNVEQAQEQWIELHNLNTVPVYVTLFDLVLTEAYSTYGTELDRMSNFNSPTGGRWAIRTDDYKKGRDGDSDYGRDFVAMQRVDNTDPTKFKIPTLARNYSHGDYAGTNPNKWIASQAVYLTKTSDLASSGILLPYGQLNYDFIGTPARPNKLTYTPPGSDDDVKVAKATQVPRSPVIFNEIANRINANRYYEWIELRNVTASEVNLRNYNISYITAKGTETTLYEFPNNDNIKIAANGILLLVDTDPKNRRDHPVAIDNPNVKYAVTDFVSNGLPDSGDFVLVLRHPEAADKAGTAKAKQGTHERVVDIAGYHPDLAEAGAPRYTNLWPFYVFAAPNLMNNRLDVETVHRRQQAGVDGTNTTGDGNHIDKTAFRDANYTGIGYKRSISDIPAHGGTPGYDNGAAKEYNDGNVTASAAPVTISEVMYHTGSSTRLLPQWIELYNSSMTEVVRVEDWTLQLENADDVSIRTPRVSVKLAAKLIQPNQTILIVASSTGNHSDHFPDMRVIDIFGNGLKDKDRLEIDSNVTRRNFKFLSETSFKITLKDKAGKVVDTVGNHGADPAWDLPEEGDSRSSLIRRYDDRVARDGTLAAWSGKGSLGDEGGEGKAAWVLASSSGLYETQDDTYYGNVTDEGSPGYRGGGPLPVSLSKFRPERLDDGSIVVRWITESELNNAGFNILRSETKDGEYTQLNTNLIAGQGTTSERTTYTYSDTSAKPNVVYYYQIQDVSLDGKVTTLRVNRLKGHISAAGKATTTWAELKALQ